MEKSIKGIYPEGNDYFGLNRVLVSIVNAGNYLKEKGFNQPSCNILGTIKSADGLLLGWDDFVKSPDKISILEKLAAKDIKFNYASSIFCKNYDSPFHVRFDRMYYTIYLKALNSEIRHSLWERIKGNTAPLSPAKFKLEYELILKKDIIIDADILEFEKRKKQIKNYAKLNGLVNITGSGDKTGTNIISETSQTKIQIPSKSQKIPNLWDIHIDEIEDIRHNKLEKYLREN